MIINLAKQSHHKVQLVLDAILNLGKAVVKQNLLV